MKPSTEVARPHTRRTAKSSQHVEDLCRGKVQVASHGGPSRQSPKPETLKKGLHAVGLCPSPTIPSGKFERDGHRLM